MEHAKLHVVDWLVFALTILISLGIGVYFSLAGDRQKTTGEYLMGARKMNLVPVTVSFMISFVSTLTLLGYPAEMYAFGAQYWLSGIGYFLGSIFAAVLYVPVFYPLKLVSINEYLMIRFNSRTVKVIGSIFLILNAVFYAANVLYGPSTAIEAVSGFPTWASILIASITCVLYTTIGGIKAVIWTNVFQCLIMFTGMFSVLIMGFMATGFTPAFQIAKEWNRLEFFEMDPSPFKRLNFYGVVFASASQFGGAYGFYQAAVQRYSALPSMSAARKCVIGSAPGMFILVSVSCLCGIVVFAYYTSIGCDPLRAGVLSNPNQVLPYFVVDAFNIPVLPGLFMASLTAASLSSTSSALSGAAANLWQDVLQDFFPGMIESRKALIIKLAVAVLGVITTLMAFAISTVGGTVVQIILTFTAAFSGPAAALFYMGVFLPWVNWKGATIGTLTSAVFGVWLSYGSYSMERNWESLPTPTFNCTVNDIWNSTDTTSFVNYALSASTTSSPVNSEISGLDQLYSISFIWLGDFVSLIAVVISLIVSFFTGFTDRSKLDTRTIHPWIVKLLGVGNSNKESKIALPETKTAKEIEKGSLEEQEPMNKQDIKI